MEKRKVNLTKDEFLEWLKALRSGDFKQGHQVLRYTLYRTDKENEIIECEYCCLGVLCELKSRKNEGRWDSDWFEIFNFSSHEFVPEVWIDHNIQKELSRMNDGVGIHNPNTFEEIANYIEENCIWSIEEKVK